MSDNKLNLCITTYNRPEETIRSFEKIISNKRINKVIIVDDKSTADNYHKLYDLLSNFNSYNLEASKIILEENEENVGMHQNKAYAILAANLEWNKTSHAILFDSDNIIDNNYIDSTPEILEDDIIYCPTFAKPNFDYRKYTGLVLDKNNIKQYLSEPEMGCLLNTCNYVVPVNNYLKVFEYNSKVKGCDTIWFNYLWLKAGYKLQIVPGMEYEHTVHAGSEFMKEVHYNLEHGKEIENLILNL